MRALKGVFVVLVSSLLLHGAMMQCFAVSEKVDQMKLIKAAKENATKELKSSLDEMVEVPFQIPDFDESVKGVCSNFPQKILKIKGKEPRKTILGHGGFGSVMEVEIDGSPKAVKYISFQRRISQWLKAVDKSKLHNSCVTSLLDNLGVVALKTNPNFPKDEEIPLRIENVNLSTLTNMLTGKKECQEHDIEKDVKPILANLINNYFGLLKTELKSSKELSNFSKKHDNDSHRTFPSFDYCIVDGDLNVYFVMEKLGNELLALRNVCRSFVGPTDLKERLSFFVQLLYKAWVVNWLGLVNCDIKLDNILFKLDSEYKKVYIIDYGHLRKDRPCRDGTKGYQAPETIYKKLNSLSPKWTKFVTPSIEQADAFAMGMVLLLIEIELKNVNSIESKYEEVSNNTSYNDLISEKSFHDMARELLEKDTKSKYEHIKIDDEKPLNFHLETLYKKVILKLLNFNYSERYPLSVALFLLHQLYLIENLKDPNLEVLRKLIDDDLELLKHLDIDPKLVPEENSLLTIEDRDRWHNTSKIFTRSIQDIQRLLKIQPKVALEVKLTI
jgi:serine/threonine protein kinase